MRFKVAIVLVLWSKDIFYEFCRTRASLLGRQGKRGLEEVEEGGFSRRTGTNDENTGMGQLKP